MDHNQQGQGQPRRHLHRGRRGPDRRGPDRRGPQPQEQAGRSDVDVEQIMRDIRTRIAQGHGIELTPQQIQDLAARRLESILDPRGIKPGLLDQLRRAAGAPPDTAPPSPDAPFTFDDTTLYASHRGPMRFIRRLLNPILKLFFNPNPLIRALNIQARVNTEAAAREAERDRRQTEWNALHYELLHRVVTENARLTLEVQNLALRVDSLGGKVDFNERRVRGIEGTMHQARPGARRDAPEPVVAASPVEAMPGEAPPAATPAPGAGQPPAEGARKRRRRRRGRRGAGAPAEGAVAGVGAAPLEGEAEIESEGDLDADAAEPDEGPDEPPMTEPDRTAAAAPVAAAQPTPVSEAMPEPVRMEQATAFPAEEPTPVPPDEPAPAPPVSGLDVDPTER
jgi:hypothetical protein